MIISQQCLCCMNSQYDLESFYQGINFFNILHFPPPEIRVQVLLNDTVIGEALCNVPILVSEEQQQNLHVDKLSLCYEVHGDSRQWFTLVTDDCAGVITDYVALSERVNVMNSIGVTVWTMTTIL